MALALALACAAAAVPVRQALACSCVGFGTPEELVGGHDVTFIGTVVDAAPGGPGQFGETTVRYAFDVDRASAPTNSTLVVRADDGTSCSIAFGMGQRWLVSAYRQDLDLHTSLCSGNLPVDDIAADDLKSFERLLANVPPAPAAADEASAPLELAAPLVVLAVALGITAFSAFMFRRRDVPRPS